MDFGILSGMKFKGSAEADHNDSTMKKLRMVEKKTNLGTQFTLTKPLMARKMKNFKIPD